MVTRPTADEVREAREAIENGLDWATTEGDAPTLSQRAAVDRVLRWVEHYVTDPGRITVDRNPLLRDQERDLLKRNGIDTGDVLTAEYERLGKTVRYRLRSSGAMVEQVLSTE